MIKITKFPNKRWVNERLYHEFPRKITSREWFPISQISVELTSASCLIDYFVRNVFKGPAVPLKTLGFLCFRCVDHKRSGNKWRFGLLLVSWCCCASSVHGRFITHTFYE